MLKSDGAFIIGQFLIAFGWLSILRPDIIFSIVKNQPKEYMKNETKVSLQISGVTVLILAYIIIVLV